jgi:hypothetical protein
MPLQLSALLFESQVENSKLSALSGHLDLVAFFENSLAGLLLDRLILAQASISRLGLLLIFILRLKFYPSG